MHKLRLTLTVLAVTLALLATAQVPQKMNYQAIARDASGNVLGNQAIGARFTIHDASPTGTIVYQETKSGLTTNQFGLFTYAIGSGTVTSGTFSAINWGSGD